MKKKILILQTILILIICSNARSEDYQYQYFQEEKEKYVPFSDYIPRVRLHYKTVPHYLEDYYLLYGMKQYYNENTLRKNIDRLETALTCKFRHPSEALVKIESQEEYLKYRRLLFMHLNLLIMRNHLTIASRYDKRKIHFYNLGFAKEISESLNTAEELYKKALPFWEEAVKHAKSASEIKITTDLGFIESERFSIKNGDINFKKIIDNYLKNIKSKKNELNNVLSASK